MRRNSRFLLVWRLVPLVALVGPIASASAADLSSKDWSCVPSIDGKTWDCGSGAEKPAQRFLTTPRAPDESVKASIGAPVGFADPNLAGPIGIAPPSSLPPRRPSVPTAAPKAPPQTMQIVTSGAAKPSVAAKPSAAPPVAARPTVKAPPAPQLEPIVLGAQPSETPPRPAARPAVAASSGVSTSALAGPRGAYTLQIIGLSRAAGIEEVAKRVQPSGLTLHRLTSERGGAPWYVLTAGEFANSADARAALKKLPADLIANGAWARQVSTLTGSWR